MLLGNWHGKVNNSNFFANNFAGVLFGLEGVFVSKTEGPVRVKSSGIPGLRGPNNN